MRQIFQQWLTKNVITKSRHPRYSMKKDVLKNFSKFTGKRLCQSLFFNKVAGLRTPPGDCFCITKEIKITVINEFGQKFRKVVFMTDDHFMKI